jgi:methylase of polypeptide subunit release factors
MGSTYVHGYDLRETQRLQDQAATLVELLHGDTTYVAGSRVLEAGCGVGAQTLTLAAQSPDAWITSIDISPESVHAAAAGHDDADRTWWITATR